MCFALRLASLGALLLGCNSTPSDLREWKPSDHDHGDRPSPGHVSTTPARGHPSPSEPGVTPMLFAAWSKHCTPCHGIVGRGDGPQGAKLEASDLSDPRWQDSTTDSEILEVIKQGRGQMPASKLPESTVQGLVHLIRRMRSDPPAAAADAGPAGSSAPADAQPPD